jgi:hypothetical protein
MHFHATDLLDVLDGTDVDPVYGDEVDNTSVAASGFPAASSESRKTTSRYDESTPATVRHVVWRVRADVRTWLRPGIRVRAQRTGRTYIVDSFTDPDVPGLVGEVRLDTRHIG